MKYKISRTSGYRDNLENPPIPEAKREPYTYIDERTVDSPEKLRDVEAQKDWVTRGTNHRVENGHIKRDLEIMHGWFAEVEDLHAFVMTHGHIILTAPYNDSGGCYSIEIYDDYRE